MSGVAFAAEPATVCDTPTAPTTPLTGTFGSIVVPAGKECDLANATINGNIAVNEGANLELLGGVHVTGNISAINAEFVLATINAPFGTTPNVVDGNVSAIGTTGDPAHPFEFVAVGFCGTIIGGNVRIADTLLSVAFGGSEPGAACQPLGGGNQVPNGNVGIEDNAGPFFRTADNLVGGNLTIIGNAGGATKRVLNNTVGKILTCLDNDAPFVVGGNTAVKLIGQCER